MKSLDNYNFKSKKVLMRVDFNVPQDDHFNVVDNTRIISSLDSIKKIIGEGGRLILISHLGRPAGVFSDKYSLKHILPELSKLLGFEVKFSDHSIGEQAKKKVDELKDGEVLLLENIRFYKEEELGDESFAKQLAELGDFYVNDAFGAAHRAHSSTCTIANFFHNKKCFGYLMEREIKALEKVFKKGKKPITAILGGAKVSSKILIIKNILNFVDYLLIGGGMSYTFIKAMGGKIGESIVEEDKKSFALEIMDQARSLGVNIYLPIDCIIANEFSQQASIKESKIDEIEDGWQALDIGVKTRELFSSIISASNTILWNGPLGVFEMEKFANGTKEIATSIKEATKKGAFSLIGGGDSIAAIKKFGFENQVSYISTGGGAMLESLEGKALPGIKAILDA